MNSASGLRDGYSTASLEFSEKSVCSVAQPPIFQGLVGERADQQRAEVSDPPDRITTRRKCGQALENSLLLEAAG